MKEFFQPYPKASIAAACSLSVVLIGLVSTSGGWRDTIIVTGLIGFIVALLVILYSELKIEEKLRVFRSWSSDAMLAYRGRILRYRNTYLYEVAERFPLSEEGVAINQLRPLPLRHAIITLSRTQIESLDMSSPSESFNTSGGQSVWCFLYEKLTGQTRQPRHFVIIGRPGTGKTTLINTMFYQIRGGRTTWRGEKAAVRLAAGCSLPGLAEDLKKALPIVLPLRDQQLIEYIYSHPDCSVVDLLNHLNIANTDNHRRWITLQLRKGRGLFLVDGLDEVPDDLLMHVRDWIDRLLQDNRNNRVIITSRPGGHKHALRHGPLNADLLKIEFFGLEEVVRFLNTWYDTYGSAQHTRRLTLLSSRRSVMHPIPTHPKAKELYNRLQRSNSLFRFAREPLLLTLMVNLHAKDMLLSERRKELYDAACKLLLGDDIKKAVTPGYDPRHVLAFLAYQMSTCEQLRITQLEGIKYLEPLREQIPSREAFLSVFQREPGILVEIEHTNYSFVHRSFQEYLTATYMVELFPQSYHLRSRIDPESDPSQNTTRWDEIWLWYAAHNDISGALLLDLYNYPIPSRELMLAIASLNEDNEAHARHAQLNARITELVEQLSTTKDEQSVIVVDKILQDRLDRMVPLTSHLWHDATLITSAEYQYFLDDHTRPQKARWPDHWERYEKNRFHTPLAFEPVSGVRHVDAEAFCHWLSQRYEGKYRLPHEDEIELLRPHPPTLQRRSETAPAIGYWYNATDKAPHIEGGAETLGLPRQRFNDYLASDFQVIDDRVQRPEAKPSPSLIDIHGYVQATRNRLTGNRSLGANADRICDEINRQPFDVDKIMNTARKIRRTLVEAEDNATNAREQYLREKRTSFERTQALARSVPNRVRSAYAKRSQPDELIRKAYSSIVSFFDVLDETIRDLYSEKEYKTLEEAYALSLIRRVREIDDQIEGMYLVFLQIENEFNQQIQSIPLQPDNLYNDMNIPPIYDTSPQPPFPVSPTSPPVSDPLAAARRQYEQAVSEQEQRRSTLQQERWELQLQIQNNELVLSEYNARQEALGEQIDRLDRIKNRTESVVNLFRSGLPLSRWAFYLRGWLTERHIRANVQIPADPDDDLSDQLSLFMIGGLLFWTKMYTRPVKTANTTLVNLPLVYDIDNSLLESAREYTQNALDKLDYIEGELEDAYTELQTAHEELQNARNKERLIELATEHTDRIRPFREYSDTLVRLCEGIIMQQNKPRTNKPRHTELYKIRLCALALAESDRQILPGGTPSPEWESTKLQVGTAYNVTPLCLKLFFYLVILEERMTEKLPATEGIRIVRERR